LEIMLAGLVCAIVTQTAAAPEVLHEFKEGLAVARVGRSGRIPFPTDAVQALLVSGSWKAPKAGDALAVTGGENRSWVELRAGAEGPFDQRPFLGGYAWFRVEWPKEQPAILEASGHGVAYVNGEPRAGDPYGFGYVRLPVLLRKGDNEFLFASGRGAFRARLVKPKSAVYLDLGDATLPDLRIGSSESEHYGAVLVVNASPEFQATLRIRAAIDGSAQISTDLPLLPPLSVQKVGFKFPGERRLKPSKGPLRLRLELRSGEGGRGLTVDRAEAEVRVRSEGQTYKRTFVSGIDGSVQYYAVNPAFAVPEGSLPALVLSLHGAGVEAIGQADAYSSKSWAHIVCPTNRRPYGFDWEDWGRLDALEVLALAMKGLRADPRRVYLTGHSMGGHGAWQLGTHFPDRFAAVGPSAGWRSFFTYGGRSRVEKPSPMEEVFERSGSSSDTEALAQNLLTMAVYVLHGDADDNVPVREARAMRDLLQPIHQAFYYHEQPGAGHWWENSDEPGAECVDWPPMFDVFARSRLPVAAEVREVEFATFNPAVSSGYGFAHILRQSVPLKRSAIRLRFDPHAFRVAGTTENVERLSLTLQSVKERRPLSIELDGQKLSTEPLFGRAREAHAVLDRAKGIWRAEAPVAAWDASSAPFEKGPHRYGPFKAAFDNRVALVYGTAGAAEENAWAYAKARFDAETFGYRGNGSLTMVSDREWMGQAGLGRALSGDSGSPSRARNVVLYGNADTNLAWKDLVAGDRFGVYRGAVRVGGRRLSGDTFGCLAVVPHLKDPYGLVGLVGGTGVRGMRLTDRLPYFVSGVAYPDWCVFGPAVLEQGVAGVVAAGLFDNAWRHWPEQSVFASQSDVFSRT
jgi:dienelactone hydrolase